MTVSPKLRAELIGFPTPLEFEHLVRERLEAQAQLERLVAALSAVDYERAQPDLRLVKQIWGRSLSHRAFVRRREAVDKFYGGGSDDHLLWHQALYVKAMAGSTVAFSNSSRRCKGPRLQLLFLP